MFFEILKTLLLQTEQEKRITYLGVLFLGLFVFILFLDSFSKGKIIPTKGPLKKIIIAMFVIIVIVAILLNYFYK